MKIWKKTLEVGGEITQNQGIENRCRLMAINSNAVTNATVLTWVTMFWCNKSTDRGTVILGRIYSSKDTKVKMAVNGLLNIEKFILGTFNIIFY